MKVLCVSRYFRMDRVLLYSSFLDRMSEFVEPVVWSTALLEPSFPREHGHARRFRLLDVEHPMPHWVTLCRHFNDHLWDFRTPTASRKSMWTHRRRHTAPVRQKVMRAMARAASRAGVGELVERAVERFLLARGWHPETWRRVAEVAPAAVMTMKPFDLHNMSIAAVARRQGIPIVAYISSWDNLTTKNRILPLYDEWIVWSEQMKAELLERYSRVRESDVHIVGAPQYDVFFQPRFLRSREETLSAFGLDPSRPVVVYCMGTPNMIQEDWGALRFLERAADDADLAGVQVIVRPHPGFSTEGCVALKEIVARFPGVFVQSSERYWRKVPFMDETGIVEWVNTIRHADVVVNLASTISVDASIFDRPVINVDFDPQPGRPNQRMVEEINREWNHWKPLAASGGVRNVRDMDELTAAVKSYLADPGQDAAGRRWIVEYVAGRVDGAAGRRIADVLLEVVDRSPARVVPMSGAG